MNNSYLIKIKWMLLKKMLDSFDYDGFIGSEEHMEQIREMIQKITDNSGIRV